MAREPLMVVVDDPNEGFVVVPSEVAQKAGYAQLLGIKPEQVPKDPQKRAAMTALYRERRAARIAREEAANKALEEQNKPFLAEQARRAEASMAEAATAPKLAKVPAVKALQNIQRFSERPAPTPAIDVAPVGRMDAPVMPQSLAAAPKMPTAPAVMAEEAPDWAQGFSPASTRVPDDEGKALLALARSQSSAPTGARAAAFAPSAEGIRSTSVPQAYAPEPMASASDAPNPEDAALLKELQDAQRSDGYSSGIRALGDQFRDAMNLILGIGGPKSNMAGTDGGYVSAAKARQALLAAQAKARRDERMTDATVDSKGRDALKDAADLEAAKAKAKKAQDEAVRSAAMEQPDSPETGRVRELAYQYLGDRVGAGGLDKLSGNEIEKVALKFGVPIINAETMAELSGERNELAGKTAEQNAAVDAARLAQSWASLSLEQQRLLLQQQQQQQTAATKVAEKVDAQTKELSEAYDKAGGPGFYTKYAEASDILGRYKKDLPGIGFFDGKKPEIVLSKDGRELQGAIGSMLAEYRKGITGAGMSESERAEYGQITGLLYSNSEDAVRQGVERMKRAMDTRVKSLAGGYKPEAVATYAGRVPMFNSVVGAAAPAQQAPDLDLSTPVREPGALPSANGRTPPSSQTKTSKPGPGQVKIKRTDNNTYYLAPAARAAELIRKNPSLWQEVERG